MKLQLTRAVKIIIAAAAVILSVVLLQEYVLCHADHNRERIKGFYDEESDSLDVVYLGASEVYSDIAPGYAYSRDGITSYLFATQANSILNYKSQIKNILSRQKNALIVVELNGAVYGDEEEVTKEANLRNYGDNVPLDSTKVDWVLNSVPYDNKSEYLFPIIKYHGIWNEPVDSGSEDEEAETSDKTVFEAEQLYRQTVLTEKGRGYNYLKGVLNWPVIFASPNKSLNNKLPANADKKLPLTETEETALRELLQYCKDEDLTNVVFTRFPHIVTEKTYERFQRGNTVGDIVAEYGFEYLNFERDIAQTGLDEKQDFYNLDHLNIYGQQKFTAFITDYLKEHYSLSPRTLNGELRAEWEECAKYYDAYTQYNEVLINSKMPSELSENDELIKKLEAYLADA